MQEALARLTRRMQMLVGIGRTSAPAQDRAGVQRQQLSLRLDGRVVDDARVLSGFGFSSSAPVGSDVVVLYLGGDRSKPVIIGTGDQLTRFRGLKPGEAAMHNANAMWVHLSGDGISIEGGGKPMTIKGVTKLRVEGPIESTQEITAKVDGTAVHLSTHGHIDPQGGTVGTPDSR